MRWRRRTKADVADEARAHIDLEADALVDEGMAPAAARREARRRFGAVNGLVARCRDNPLGAVGTLASDVRAAWRNMRRFRTATLVAVVSLGAGIGATASALLLRNAIFLASPPTYVAPASLSAIGLSTPERYYEGVPIELYRLWRQDEALAAGLGAGVGTVPREVRLFETTTSAGVHAVTRGLFSRLGVRPFVGSSFDALPADGPAPAILSYGAWQRLAWGRLDIVGQPIWIDSTPLTVVGVMPPRFWFGNIDAPIWIVADERTMPAGTTLDVVMRRPPGMTPAALASRLRAGVQAYTAAQPIAERSVRLRVEPSGGTPIGRHVGPMVVVLLGGAVTLVFLIACTNVAVLMMAQWTSRGREMSVRSALGGSRGRIVRGLIVEAALVAAAGGVLGVLVALGLRHLALVSGGVASFFNLDVDVPLLIQVAAVTAVAGLAIGLVPALLETRHVMATPLDCVRGGEGGARYWRHGFVVFEIAATMALLVVTAAMFSAYTRALDPRPGFDPRPLLGVAIAWEDPSSDAVARVLERLERMPEVAAAAASTALPYFSGASERQVSDAAGTGATLHVETVAAGPGFLRTLGVPVTAGRAFDAADTQGAPPVAMVNESLAASLWPAASPLGRVVSIDGIGHEVVGVAANYAGNSLRPVRPMAFVPLAQELAAPEPIRILVRTVDSPRATARRLPDPSRPTPPPSVARHIRREVEGLRLGTVTSVTGMSRIIEIIGQEILVGTLPMVPLIVTGLLLTAAGIYAVLAFAVSRRSAEVAIRVAVGATPTHVVRVVALQMARLATAGVAIGVGATFVLTRVAQGRGGMFDSPGWHTFIIPMVIIVGAAILATALPVRRALAVDAARLLRDL